MVTIGRNLSIDSPNLGRPDVWQLFHQTLCPFSRTVRLLLGELRLAYELGEVAPDNDPHRARTGYRDILPRLCDPIRGITLTGHWSVCEYLEETALVPRMLIGSAEQRAEIRRLVAWADQDFYEHVTQPELAGRLPGSAGRRTKVSYGLSRAVRNADTLLDELDTLLDRRMWLAGPTLTLADLVAAAQVSVADYFGVINWSGHDQAQTWYSVLKSRRCFQPLLADRVEGIIPPRHYAQIDS